ncbi:hypothetical protein DPQ33_02740 [Oceanidesulfovibrio indonesiensis]|uniref:DUF1980 domain-containing protein n=1 Tax=Oceanidesulfovibrio indonesiensis TaxID=54767 RepID=A0A7M3MIS4_9BACT|nr:hypothetical protein [Oceanidesulfovibrio indonesiensis]TVM19295.1 hypothetical protein DPQ33_02740 [Oceanidesulfovibrio indonesiensis]
MSALARLLQACLVAATGAFMLMLAASPIYWRFLNPKYAWLTLSAGGIIALLALAVLLDRSRTVRASEAAGLVVFLLLAGTAVTLPNPFYDVVPSGLSGEEYAEWTTPGFDGAAERATPAFDDAQETTDSKIVLDGVAFTKINVAELLTAEQDQRARAGDAFVVQGQVARTPELDAAGYIAVTRLFIVCCFADAAGVAYLVDVNDPQQFPPGSWVHAAGTLAPASGLPDKIPLSVPGALSAMAGDTFVLTGHRVALGPMPDIPFLFEVRYQEPYAY